MITILFSMTIKAGREAEWRSMRADVHRTTHAEDDGCLAYDFYRRADNPREYVLFEQWRDEAALDAHLARVRRVYGPPPTPGGRLPAVFLDLFDRTEAIRYEPGD
jgi:quinol monooxygenase YgiN